MTLYGTGRSRISRSEARATLIGGEDWDAVLVVEYPSRKAFAEIAQDPLVRDNIGKHRAAGLEMQWLIAMTENPL